MNQIATLNQEEIINNKIMDNLSRNRAVRIGETTVVSRNVHYIDNRMPEEIKILTKSDAGETFYHREHAGEVIHMDIFHEVGVLDHVALASILQEVLPKYLDPAKCNYLDYIDIQTGSGGGRLTGSLKYGNKSSIKKAHLNHVHITLKYEEDNLFLLLILIEAVENEIMRQGKEIRKIERIKHILGKSSNKADLSPYTTDFDSMLKNESPKYGSETREYEKKELALEISREIGTLQDTLDILDKLYISKGDLKSCSEMYRKYGNYKDILDILMQKKIIEKKLNKIELTQEGKELRDYLKWHAKEIQSNLNKIMKKLPFKPSIYINTKYSKKTFSNQGKSRNTSVYMSQKNEWIKEIAIPETIITSIKRSRRENADFYLKREDIYEKNPYLDKPLDICLLIDTSASMTGDRIKSAKFLAEYLVNSTRDRVSVIVFQENDVEVIVPFTRNFNMIQKNLSKIDSKGLTPLALAIEKSLEYIKKKKKKETLMMLITDGIPTVSVWSSDPVMDAIKAASEIPKKDICFSCIGLQPNKKYLEKIAKEGQGNLYIVDELKTDLLIYIANKERKAR